MTDRDKPNWPIVVTDSRSKTVVIQRHTVDHAKPHFGYDFETTKEKIVEVCRDPDMVLPNHSNTRISRTGQEKYCRYDQGRGEHLIVPVKIERAGENETRTALSVYSSESSPRERRLWVRST